MMASHPARPPACYRLDVEYFGLSRELDMRRREFITPLGATAAAWPPAARAQQGKRMRRIGLLPPAAAGRSGISGRHRRGFKRNACFPAGLTPREMPMTPSTVRVTFPGSLGDELAARLDLPAGPVRAYALFAHCFTCSKDIIAARHIAAKLAALGIAVLRFDFTGLGSSQGEFANT